MNTCHSSLLDVVIFNSLIFKLLFQKRDISSENDPTGAQVLIKIVKSGGSHQKIIRPLRTMRRSLMTVTRQSCIIRIGGYLVIEHFLYV